MACKQIKDPKHPHKKITLGCTPVLPYIAGETVVFYKAKNNLISTDLVVVPLSGWGKSDTVKGVSRLATGLRVFATIETKKGPDALIGRASAAGMHGKHDTGHGISMSALVNLGPGSDVVKASNFARGRAGLLVNSRLIGGLGNDRIKAVGHIGSGLRIGSYTRDSLPQKGLVIMGPGDDEIIARSKANNNGTALMIEDGAMKMGKGDDLIDVTQGGIKNYIGLTPDGGRAPSSKVSMGPGDDIFKGFAAPKFSSATRNKVFVDGGSGFDELVVNSGRFLHHNLSGGSHLLRLNEYTSLTLDNFERVKIGSTRYELESLSDNQLISG